MVLTPEKKAIQLLKRKKKTISVAESCTGGLLSSRLTSVPGASNVFGFGVVSYSAAAKRKLLKISRKLIRKHGEVSKEVALAMAEGILRLSGSDVAISITGIAGPTGGTRQKPVGLIYLSLISKGAEHIKKLKLCGSRLEIQRRTTTLALNWLCRVLNTQL